MGLFNFLPGKKPSPPAAPAAPAPSVAKTGADAPPPAAEPELDSVFGAAPVSLQAPVDEAPAPEPIAPDEIPVVLHEAHAHLERKDLPGALLLYEQLLAAGGDTPEAMMTLSADLGANGFIDALVELLTPVYDPERHGVPAGLNLLQAYLAQKNDIAAQTLLDVLVAVGDPGSATRLQGFARALEELRTARTGGLRVAGKISLVTISKPIWSYGLEEQSGLLPEKTGSTRRITFVPFAVSRPPPDRGKVIEPDPAVLALARALPLVGAEAFYFTRPYLPLAVVMMVEKEGYLPLAAELLPEQVKQLGTAEGGDADYAVTGVLQSEGGQITVGLRVWEAKKARARKFFTATAAYDGLGEAFLGLLKQVLHYMEAQPVEGTTLPPLPAAMPTGYLATTALSLDLFLAEKNILPKEQLENISARLAAAAQLAAAHPAEPRVPRVLQTLELRRRALDLG